MYSDCNFGASTPDYILFKLESGKKFNKYDPLGVGVYTFNVTISGPMHRLDNG